MARTLRITMRRQGTCRGGKVKYRRRRRNRRADRHGFVVAMKKILIVDDETLFLDRLRQALQTSETTVRAVDRGETALAEIAATAYDLCFLDVQLPGISGREVFALISKISPQTRVVMMSAGVISEELKQEIRERAALFIAKPIDLCQVRQMVRELLVSP